MANRYELSDEAWVWSPISSSKPMAEGARALATD